MTFQRQLSARTSLRHHLIARSQIDRPAGDEHDNKNDELYIIRSYSWRRRLSCTVLSVLLHRKQQLTENIRHLDSHFLRRVGDGRLVPKLQQMHGSILHGASI